MARTKNAKKAHRASLRRRVFNLRKKKAIHDTVKKLEKAKGKDAIATLHELYQAVDKAAKHGTISKNKAARMKSRLTKRLATAK